MLPIFATIPALPSSLLRILAVLVLLGAVAWTAWNFSRVHRIAATNSVNGEEIVLAREDQTSPWTPLIIGAFILIAMMAWSRGEIKLHSYGLLLIIGFLAATWNATKEAKRRGYDPNIIIDLALPLLLICIVCCRLLYVVLNRSQFSSWSEVIRIWDGGLSFHGALVGAVAVVAFFGWQRGMGFWRLGDCIAPSVFLGYAFGRVGCFLNGCCYGGACDLPWAMVFPVEGGPRGAFTLPSHPAQIYSALLALGLFAWMQRAKLQPMFNRFAGQLTLLFMALYAIERFIIEIFRNGATARRVLGTSWLTEAQLLSLIGLVFIAAFWVLRSRTASNHAPMNSDAPPTSALS